MQIDMQTVGYKDRRIDRRTYRQTDTAIQKDRQINRWKMVRQKRQMDRLIYNRWIDRQADKQIDNQIYRQTYRQTNKQMNRQIRCIDRQIDK